MERKLFWKILFILFMTTMAGCGGDGSAPAIQGILGTGLPEAGGGPVPDIPKTLSVTKTGVGSGVISSPTLSIDCGLICSAVSSNAWVPIATPAAETLSGRYAHTAIWTGTEMIIWGGWAGTFSNTGSRYNPATNRWTAIATPPSSVISARDQHSAIWTGTEMIIWGGREGGFSSTTGAVGDESSNAGARYDPVNDTWTTITSPPSNILKARMGHTAVWTGTEMIVWGGFEFGLNAPVSTGAKYNPATDTWTTIITPPPFLLFAGRERHSAVWTGTEMIVWGGIGDQIFNNGVKYNPTTNAWTTIATPLPNMLGGRRLHSAVWNGTEMVIWGGFELGAVDVKSGAKYNPATNSWKAILTPAAFSGRGWHSAVWTTTDEMIILGGVDSLNQIFNDGSSFKEKNGEIITLTATPGTGSTFTGWSGLDTCTGTGPCVINVDGDQSIVANFD